MYPEICIKWCANFGTPECPNSAKCMGTTDKPYFKVKPVKGGFIAEWQRKREIKRICKAENHDCNKCVYKAAYWCEFPLKHVMGIKYKCRLTGEWTNEMECRFCTACRRRCHEMDKR